VENRTSNEKRKKEHIKLEKRKAIEKGKSHHISEMQKSKNWTKGVGRTGGKRPSAQYSKGKKTHKKSVSCFQRRKTRGDNTERNKKRNGNQDKKKRKGTCGLCFKKKQKVTHATASSS